MSNRSIFHFCSFTKGVANECQPGVLWRKCVFCGRTEATPVPGYVAPKTIPFDEFYEQLTKETEKKMTEPKTLTPQEALRVHIKSNSEYFTVVVDRCDEFLFVKYKWQIDKHGYAQRTFKISGTRRNTSEKLHRAILGLSANDGIFVDHINRNRLDCRRQNLRVVTAQENATNASIRKDNTSGFKGVSKSAVSPKNPWMAKISYKRQRFYLGMHPTKIDAAIAYNIAAYTLHGEHAHLNNIPFIASCPTIEKMIANPWAYTPTGRKIEV